MLNNYSPHTYLSCIFSKFIISLNLSFFFKFSKKSMYDFKIFMI